MLATQDWTAEVEAAEIGPGDWAAHRAFPSLVAAAATGTRVSLATAQDWACLPRGARLDAMFESLRAFCTVKGLPPLASVVTINADRPGQQADVLWEEVRAHDWSFICWANPGDFARARHLYRHAREPIIDYHALRDALTSLTAGQQRTEIVINEFPAVEGKLGDLGLDPLFELLRTGPTNRPVRSVVAAYNLLSRWQPSGEPLAGRTVRAARFELAGSILTEANSPNQKLGWYLQT